MNINIENEINSINKYELKMERQIQKETGSFYTDHSIVRYMLCSIFKNLNIVKNPFLKIFDPACGSGYFLIEAYDILKGMFINNMFEINMKYPALKLSISSVHEHILKYNIFGADIDENAVNLATNSLKLKCKNSHKSPNIICCDSLIQLEESGDLWKMGFDIIAGNPPYIGHKKITGQYHKSLNSKYRDIFKDKADISFCFIKSSIDNLSEGGSLCFITSRYFIESPSGRELRKYIMENCIIEKLIDFYGVRIMKGISVDPVIIFFKKSKFSQNNYIKIFKAEPSLKSIKPNLVFNELENKSTSHFRCFEILQKNLKYEGWSLCSDTEMAIVKKIESNTKMKLMDICGSFQGIITGCDKAFIIDGPDIEKLNIEHELIKPWIKNSSIKKFKVEKSSHFIIYSDIIDNPEKYENSISYISNYREKLEKRRECLKGSRKWYQLQWGREIELFEMEKIIFPYKSSYNRFAIDRGSYSSADVYGMFIKEEFKDNLSYKFITGILNSSLYEFYFKTYAKKLGDNMYDYYPNTVMRLMLPCICDNYIVNKVDKILNTILEDELDILLDDIDSYIYNMFNISEDEIKIIKERTAKK